jgi:hypothetical protein
MAAHFELTHPARSRIGERANQEEETAAPLDANESASLQSY